MTQLGMREEHRGRDAGKVVLVLARVMLVRNPEGTLCHDFQKCARVDLS